MGPAPSLLLLVNPTGGGGGGQFLIGPFLRAGFDRHLLGLYLIAKEEGRPTPELFLDPLYAKR